jgi:molybdopterin/thiamine biosynthesis adenylyltransferase
MDNYYQSAVSRNLGIVAADEQIRLSNARVAVAGLGGVGGIHFLTLVRMGIGAFNIADLDEFSEVNANRQVGATSSTAGRRKTEVMAEMARDIHPSVELELFDKGVQPDNVERFLGDVDAVVDSIDFFQMKARRLLYKEARRLGKTVVFSAPIGFSGTLHIFTPDSMSFDDFFDINDSMSPYEQLVAFAVGLCPRGTHWKYMDTRKVNLAAQSGPSIASACDISAGLLTTEILSVLLNRRPLKAVPHYVQFDPYRRIYRKGYLFFGNRGPLQRLKRWFVARRFREQAASID